MYKQLAVLAVAVLLAVGVDQGASAAPAVTDKVTICHGTNAVNNPYVRNTVDADAADGNTGNDNGQGDHSQHTGPVPTTEAEAQALKNAKTAWGDIIPPHHNYAGLNWTTEGQAIYNNGCNYVDRTTPPNGGMGGSTTNPTASAPGSQPGAANLSAGVNAGNGGGAQTAIVSLAALTGSVLTLGYGFLRLRKASSL